MMGRVNVYYELYIDIFFLINLIMNFIVLSTVDVLLNRKSKMLRRLAGSIISSLISCIAVIVPFSILNSTVKYFLISLIINIFMIKWVLKTFSFLEVLKGIILLYLVSFLYGGIIIWRGIGDNSISYILQRAVCGMILVKAVNLLFKYISIKNNNIYKVKIIIGEKIFDIKGLLDTGNTLRDPYNMKPVSIMEETKIMGDAKKIKFRYIPYHSIGENNGLMEVFTADKMYIYFKGREIYIENAVIGLTDKKLSKSDLYQIILNSAICEIC